MTERIEFKGIWFLPNRRDEEIEGNLVYEPEGRIILDITGAFEDIIDSSRKLDIILGFTTKGKNITLVNCSRLTSSIGFPGIATSIYIVSCFFEGLHFFNLQDIKFYKLKSKISKFAEWINIYGFEKQINTTTKEITAKFNIPNNVEFTINEELKGEFTFSYNTNLSPGPDFSINQITEFNLISKEEKSYLEFFKNLIHFKLFVSLGIFNDVNVIEMFFFSKLQTSELRNGTKYELPIKFYYSNSSFNTKINKLNAHDFLFNYKDISENFESIIQKWFLLKETVSPVMDVLFETFSNQTLHLESRFLHIVQALEIYHRRVKENSETLKVEFDKVLNPILLRLTQEQKEWIIEKLEYRYEPNLRKRLSELFKEFRIKPLSEIVISKDEIKSIINKTTITRNYLTHFNIHLKERACHGEELFHLSEKLKVLMIIVILSETGFQPKEIETFFARNSWRYFNHILKRRD